VFYNLNNAEFTNTLIIIIIIMNDNLYSAVCTNALQGRLQNEKVQYSGNKYAKQ